VSYLAEAWSVGEGLAALERSGATGQNQCIGSIQTVRPTAKATTVPIPRGTPVRDQISSYINAKEMNHSGPATRRFMPR